ncbi:NepR family anti-sigma factor [Blastomonas sp. AAP53]|uniref:NepR family anti-sigma factor n=1 Tax=Blastomonas sp. AAP53 TaxID=1248760 RepID=UPI00031BF768|nr:NepR family anti-sigma factor [Blastomonas sp. AAP53]
MLVHRKNDDQSGAQKPLVVSADADATTEQASPATPTATPLPGVTDEDGSAGTGENSLGDDGKTHMIGDALKSVYQRTLEEEIPDDFLDLLKQLK